MFVRSKRAVADMRRERRLAQLATVTEQAGGIAAQLRRDAPSVRTSIPGHHSSSAPLIFGVVGVRVADRVASEARAQPWVVSGSVCSTEEGEE